MAGGAVAAADGGVMFPGRFTPVLVLVSMVAAFGGLMFGYEIGIAGGAIGFDSFLKKFFNDIYEEKTAAVESKYCKFDDEKYQVIISSLFLVGAFVSPIAAPIQKMIGRKWTMFISSVFFLGGSAMLAFAESVAMVILGRVLWGVCLGLANSSVPLYLSEMAPGNHRGVLNVLFQLFTTIGIWCAAILNWALVNVHDTPDNAWRWAFGMSVVPGAMMFLGSLFLPNTPSSLIELGRKEEARAVLQLVRGSGDVEGEFNWLVASDQEARAKSLSWKKQVELCMTKPYFPSLVVCFTVPFLQQLSGINCIMFYSNQLFEIIGVDSPFQQTMILQAVNCLTTFGAVFLVDVVGRRPLLAEGAVQMAVCLIIVSAMTGSSKSEDGDTAAGFTIFFMCFFVAGFAWSWGPLGWLVPTEIVPLEVRSVLFSGATFSNFIFTFVIGQWFNTWMCHMEYGVYLFFAFMCLCALAFSLLLLPETKGMKLEDISNVLARHPIWYRCFTGVKSTDVEMGTNKIMTTSPSGVTAVTPTNPSQTPSF